MFLGRRRVRPDESRQTWAAFALLFGLISGHAVLETARDALFLASIPPTRLPWVYIGIAAVSLAIAQAQARFAAGIDRRRALAIWIGSAAAITFGFWFALDRLGAAGLYALYIWSGVLTTLVLVHFWSLLGSLFSVTQAKRLYSLIGTGSVLGAIVGSAGASALAALVEAQHLLLVSAGAFLATAVVPTLFPSGRSEPGGGKKEKDGLVESARFVVRQPYALRVAMFVVVSTMALTLGDYVFKATVADLVPTSKLGSFFGATYLVLNVLSLLSQVAVVSFVIRRFDLATALSILPVLVLAGAAGFLVFPGLMAALLIKGADGALKHSVHRTSTELMFVPFTDRSRARVKAFIDVVGQRGGQTIASIAVLGFAATTLPLSWLAGALVVVTGFWVAGAIDIRRHYVDVFRSRVRRGVGFDDFPELDVATLETLLATLDSDNEGEVMAALAVLDREQKTRVVPGLILYHPAEEVVLKALSLFVKEGRLRSLPKIDRLLEHESERIRAAAVGARARLDPNPRSLRLRLSMEESPTVRAAIMINLVGMGEIVGGEADDIIESFILNGTIETKVALAEAIGRRGDDKLVPTLVRLGRAAEPEVQRAAAAAMSMGPHEEFFEPLLIMLGREPTSSAARASLFGYGEIAFDRLVAALRANELDMASLRAIPRLLCAFDHDTLPDVLTETAVSHPSGHVRYAAIQALEYLVQIDPTVELEEDRVVAAVEENLARAYRLLDRRVALQKAAEADTALATPGHGLLVRALRDKEAHAADRAFRLVGLLHPFERFSNIRRDALGDDETARTNAIELLDNLLRPPLRAEVIGLVDDVPDEERRSAGARLHNPKLLDYEPLLDELLGEMSDAIQDITVFHIGELRLERFEPRLRGMDRENRGDLDRALERLMQGKEVEHAR